MPISNAIVASMSPRRADETSKSSTPFLDKMHELFNPDDIWEAGRRLGVINRDRKIDLPALVEGTVLALSGLPGAQTSGFANYLQLAGHEPWPVGASGSTMRSPQVCSTSSKAWLISMSRSRPA